MGETLLYTYLIDVVCCINRDKLWECVSSDIFQGNLLL